MHSVRAHDGYPPLRTIMDAPVRYDNKMAEIYPVSPGLFEHVMRSIMSFLPIGDIYHFLQACKPLRSVGTSQALWRILLYRDYTLKKAPSEGKHTDFYSLYKQLYATAFANGVGIRLSCSKDSLELGKGTIFTTTIYNNNDHAVLAFNQRPIHPHQYETAALFCSAWQHDDDELHINSSLPTYGTYQQAGKTISLTPSVEVGVSATKVLPPRSCTEFSVVGMLCEQPGSFTSTTEGDSLFVAFPSHHLKVAEKNTREFWMRTKVCFEATELISNVIKLQITGKRATMEKITAA